MEERISSVMAQFDGESVESLTERIRSLEADLNRRNEHVARLEKANKELSARVQEASEGQSTAEISEIEETLKRLMQRIGMIVQGSKVLFMIHDPENRELVADTPAIGFDDELVKNIRIKDNVGVSGECFQENKPYIVYDAATDPKAAEQNLAELGVSNAVCVPLIVEKRDDETQKLMDRKTIGVLHVFNKRFGNIFIDEDITLLARLARNAAAVIGSAEAFRKVVKERDEVIETIQSLSMGLVMINRNQRIAQMNQSAMRIFGLTKDDLAGGRTFDAVIKDETVRDILTKALDQESIQQEVTLSSPDNAEQFHTFQVQSALVRGEGGDLIGTATIFNDITEIKNVDKMKTAFVSTVSHELRTPLTSIKGFISTLVQDTEGFYDTETRHEFYTIIDKECDRLRRLIDDLLNVSRIESGNALQMNIGQVNLPEVVAKAVTIQNGSTYKKPSHSIAFDLSPDIPVPIQADEDKVEQILANLVSNALKYSPKGGEIKITGRMMSPELIQMAVSDQGMGIPKEHLAKMGERFHRIDNRDTREIGGTGIGLFLVKALVEQHGGKMWVESEVGKGSTFFFSLPTTQADDDGGTLASQIAG